MKYNQNTVLVPVYNGECTLDRALSSLSLQHQLPEEIVVVDDGSTDRTPEIIVKWSKILPIKHVSLNENGGLVAALQLAFRISTGSLVFRLDADDSWEPDHLAKIQYLSETNPNAVLFCSRAHVIGGDGEIVGVSDALNDKTVRRFLMWDNPLVHSAVAFRRPAYEATGGYSQGEFPEDYDLWVRLLQVGAFVGAEDITVKYHVLPNSLSRVKKTIAIRGRIVVQNKAIRSFGKIYPIRATLISIAISCRQTPSFLKLFTQKFNKKQ